MEGLSMRPWIIVLSSAIFAIAVAAAMAIAEAQNAPSSEIMPILLQHLPALAVVALAMYGLSATLMVTASLLAVVMRARDDLPPDQSGVAAFGANGFRELASRLAQTTAQPGRADSPLGERRTKIARLHYISLAQSHFFSAIIVLAAIIALGLARDYASLPFPGGAIPTISGILVLVGLVLLTVLGRIAIDVTAEPLFEAISQLPAERESELLRRAIESLEQACDAIRSGDRTPASSVQFPERLVAVLEQNHHALLDTVDRLAANTQALGATVQSSAEKIETTIRTTAAQQPPMDDNEAAAGTSGFRELQAAVEELTTVLHQLATAPQRAEEPPLAADPVPPRRRAPPPRLAGELRRLLQEIDATC
jgi:hypothetical protein